MKREPITYADSVPGLPESSFAERLREVRITRLFAAANDDQPWLSQERERGADRVRPRTMVEEDHPHPVPRPSPDWAAEVDAEAFNARWEAERQRHTLFHSPPTQTGERSMSDTQNEPRRPEETLREGPLKAAIWRNEGENGPYHSVTVARTYKDRDGKLQDTQSFRPKDMLGLSELARRAHHDAHELDRAAFKERRQAQSGHAQAQTRGHTR